MKVISEGFSNDYLIHSILIGFLALPFFFFHWVVGALLVILSIVFACVQSGIEIDPTTKSIRVFRKVAFLKKGRWISLESVESLFLMYNQGATLLQSRGSAVTSRVKSYSLYLIAIDSKKTEFHEFTDYQKAVETLQALHSLFDLPFTNEVEEKRHAAILKRQNRRR